MAPVVAAALVTSGIALTKGFMSGLGQIEANKGQRAALEYIAEQSKLLAGEVGQRRDQRVGELGTLYGADGNGNIPEAGQLPELYQKLTDYANQDLSKYDVQAPGDFQFDLEKATQEEMNPYLTDITDAAVGDVTQSAANAGQLFSGAAGKDIARATFDIRAKEQGAARERAIGREKMKYQQFQDKFNNIISANQFNRDNMTTGANLVKGAYETGAQTRSDYSGQRTGINTAADTQEFELRSDAIAAEGKKKGVPGGFGAFLQGFGGVSTEV